MNRETLLQVPFGDQAWQSFFSCGRGGAKSAASGRKIRGRI